ncbi:MAG: Glutathione S-transferase domain protein [Roseomonas sp.]|nr:Glutathione S-transferase domain protein [Roseomonas sp.]
MTLLWSSRSPFVRKVMVVAHEAGVAQALRLERMVVSGATMTPEVMALNPLNKIPTLVLVDGSALFDSPVIAEYLSTTHAGGALLPAEGEAHWQALRLQALGDGLMELSIARIAEAGRGEARSAEREAAFQAKTVATLDLLEREAASLAPVTLGSIAVACALAHLDFRFPGDDWPGARPSLAAWHADFGTRTSMRETAFQDIY